MAVADTVGLLHKKVWETVRKRPVTSDLSDLRQIMQETSQRAINLGQQLTSS